MRSLYKAPPHSQVTDTLYMGGVGDPRPSMLGGASLLNKLTIRKRKNFSKMNAAMQNNVTKAAQQYLNAVRQLRWFDVCEDIDTLVAVVPSLVDAGFDRSEILDALGHMGQEDGEWLDTVLEPISEDRPWMNWGRSLN